MAGIDWEKGSLSSPQRPVADGGVDWESGVISNGEPEKSSLARRLIGDTAVSAVKGAIGLTEVPVGIADMATGGMAGKALEGIGYRPKEAKAMLDEMYSPEQKAANKAVSDAEGFFGTAKTALQNPSTIGQSVVESLPLLLPGAAIARGVGAAGKIAPAVAGGIGEGVVGAGLAAEQMRQNSEDGTLYARQTGAALASGAGTAAFGIAGGKLAQSAIGRKLGLADVDTALAMSPAQRAAAGGIDAGIAKRIAGGAVSEGLLEELPQSMWEQAAQNYGEGKPIGEGVAEAGAMGALAGGVMGGGFNALQGRLRGTVEQQPPVPAQEAPRALLAPTYTGTPNDQTMAAEVERANQVAAAQANADALYAERAAFEQERAPAKLPVTGPMSAAVNVGIDSGATSITSPANPRYEIPAQPRGSFAQLDELASLIGQERADVADRRELAQLVGQERRDQERRIAEVADSRRALDAALADTDQRAAGVAAQESEAARLRLLDNILSSVSDTGNPARQFGNALRRAGYQNTDFTERERQVIQRFSDARAALRSPEATTVPAAPNELDAASLGIRERSTAGAMQGASGRDKIGEAVSLLSQGWKLALNKTLVSPTGKRRKLNAEEFAAVREARAKMINKTEAGNAATQVDAVSDQGRGDVAAGGIGNAQPVRSIARGRGRNSGAPVPGMRAAGAVGNAGGAGSALNAAEFEQVAQKAAQADGAQVASAGDQIAIKNASPSAATIPAKTPAENQNLIKKAEAAPAGAQQQQKEPKNGMQEGRRQEEVAAQTPAVTTPPAESFGLVEPVKDLSEASRQALYESLKDRLTKGEITLQYGQRQMAAFDEAVKAEEEAKSGAQEAKQGQSKPDDVSKIPQKTNTSGEPVQKTAENEQVESADKLDPAKIRAGYAHRSLGGLGDKVKLEQIWFDKASEAFAEKVGEKAESEEQKALSAKLLDEFKEEYKTRRYRVMRIGETVVSSAVAGRNKFNSAQAGRRGSALDRAEQEFTDWQNDAIESGVRAIRAARSPEQVAAEQQAKADKAAKKKADLHALLGKLLDFKKGDGTLFGKYPVARVSLDKAGYPSSVTVDATDLTDNKFDIARILFDGDKEKLRAAVDKIRASRTVAEEQPSDSGPLSLVDQHNADIAKLFDGELSVDELKAAFAMVRDNRAAIEAELSKFKKDELLRSGGPMFGARYKSETKPEIVKAAYAAMLDNFIMGESISYALGGGVDWVTTKVKALQARVDAATPESLAAYAAKIKANRADSEQRRDEVAKSIADPKTLDDFRRLMQSKVDSGKTVEEARFELTPEQRARFDMLLAEESRGRRSASAEASKTDVRAAAQTTTGDIIETKHTKTGVPLFVVKAAERVDRDIYNEWNANAKRLGGWYSSFRGNGAVPGFQFKTRENAAAFLQYLGGDTTAAKEAIAERRDAFADDRSQSAVERLNEMADRLEERADESLGRERKANTARRARFAASAEAAANSDKALARTMRNIADAISAGTTKFLDRVRQKAQVEMLRSTVRTAQYSELQKKYPSYAEQEKHRGEKPTAETADYARWPTFTADRSDLARLGRDLLQIDGAKQLGQRILKVADDVTDAYQKFAKENLHKVSVFSAKREGSDEKHMAVFPTADKAEAAIARSGFKGKATTVSFKRGEHLVIMGPEMAREAGLWQGDPDKRITLNAEAGEEIVAKVKALGKGKVTMPHVFESVAAERARWKALGIETPAEFRSALREFIALQESPVAPDRIKQMERAMIGRANDGLDFFPTPAETAKAMIEAAEISEGMAVLEPSAGMGHIAEQIRDVAGVDPDVVEFNGDRRELLEAKGFNVVGSDFLDLSPRGFTYGDVFRDNDGVEGIMRGSGGMGSNRVGFVPLGKDERQREWRDRDELEGVRKSGYNSGYDRIIMNPPFSNRRDAEHVQHAYSLLKPGGRLVAIMGEGVFYGQDKKAQAFREWLEAVGGTSEKLEEGTFLDPSLPVNTGANARMVVVDKPAGRETTSGSTGQNFESRSATSSLTINVDGVDRPRMNSNGKPIAQTDEGLRNFWRWFGDSKVTDDQGRPLVVYHGTRRPFDVFSPSNPRGAIGNQKGVYFTADKSVAEEYAQDVDGAWDEKSRVIAAYIKIESDADGKVIDSAYRGREYVVFKPENIKSATENSGDFDGGNPDIRESRADQKPLNAQQKFALNIVQKTADRFRAEYTGASALDIRVVYSRDDIPEFFRPSPYAEGVYHDREGIIYLVASNLPTRQRAWQVLMHETVGHYGMANMMGDQFSSLWETVLKRAVSSQPLNRNPQPGEANYETVDAVRRLYPEASDAEVAQEVLARMAETMPNVGWFRMAMARIRVWLKNAAKAFWLKLEPTMDDVRRMVELASYHVRSGANLERAPAGQDAVFASRGAQSNISGMADKDTVAGTQAPTSAGDGSTGSAKTIIPETIDVDGVLRKTRNSKGNLIAETKQSLVNFWRWFGDSKVVDAKGRPLVLYHGTNVDFDSFDLDFDSRGVGGFWLSDSEIYSWDYFGNGDNGKVIRLYAKSSNPFVFDVIKEAEFLAEDLGIDAPQDSADAQRLIAENNGWWDLAVSLAVEKAQAAGNDSVVISSFSDGRIADTTAFVLWNPSSVKSAIPRSKLSFEEYISGRGIQEKDGKFFAHGFELRSTRKSLELDWKEEVDLREKFGASDFDSKSTKIIDTSEPNEPTASAGSDAMESRTATIGRNESIIDQMRNAGRRMAGSAWSVSEPSKIDDLIYSLQDKQIDLKRVIQSIAATGKKIGDDINAYLQEELFHGRSAKGVKDFLDFELRPLLREMQMLGIDMSDFEEYLWNRHAEERNNQIAKINPDMPDGGSGINTADARAYLAELSADQKRKMEALAARIDQMNRNSQRVLVESGLEKQETIDAWNGAYQHYVPLQREDVDSGHVGTGKGFSVRGSSSKRAMGSGKKVVDIIANLTQQRERNIVRAEKNRVSNALFGLAAQNPNPDFWKIDEAPKERVVQEMAIYAVLDSDGKKIDEFTRMDDAERLASKTPGATIDQSWADRVTERIVPGFKNRDNVILTRIDGEDHYVILNERDDRAMRLSAAMKNLDMDNMGRALSVVGKATRYLASVNTQYNPVFGVINLIRDVQGALLNLQSTQLAGEQKRVAGYTVDALRGIYADIRSHRRGEKPSSKWAELFEEFQKEGGQTGYRDQYANAEARAEAIMSELNQFKEGKLKLGARAMFGWLSDYNETMENAVRLAAYKTAKEKGLSNQQAASIAKNLTVNFNRKGQMTTQIGALYAFFNASVQGTARMAETLFEKNDGDAKKIRLSKLGKRIISGGIMLGSMQAMLLAAAGFDDDEPPEFVRERNLILPTGDGKYLTLAMPLGFHVIPGIGRIATEFALSGFKDPAKRIVSMFGMLAETFNPVGSSGFSIQTLTPSVVDPFAALSENRDFTGREIYRENFSANDPAPGHTRAKDVATPWSRYLSESINFITGGTEFKPGAFSPSPDAIDYLIAQATGGVGREINKAAQTVGAAYTGDDLPLYKIPLVGRFVGDTEGQSGTSQKFYGAIREINAHEREVKGLRESGRVIEAKEYIADNPVYRMRLFANLVENQVRKLRDARRKASDDGDSDRVRAINDQITRMMTGFNERALPLINQSSTEF